MLRIAMPRIGFAEAWRKAARDLLLLGVEPGDVDWVEEGAEGGLFDTLADPQGVRAPIAAPTVPKSFLPVAEAAICHSSPERFSLPYRVLWRLQANRNLIEDRADPDIAVLHGMEKSVRRDNHKAHAFVRFRELGISEAGRRQFGAWFEPEHHIVELTAPFFMRRFADMDWMIATPDAVARFVDGELSIIAGEARPDLPDDDADDLWRTYFANIFNPARLKVQAMKSEMPVKYWKNMPEARLIPEMIAGADKAAAEMQARMPSLAHKRTERIVGRIAPTQEAGEAKGDFSSINEARSAAATCQRCDLCKYATQTVFGEGQEGADVMFVGEQPGDREDLVGRPFVGPAGQLLDSVLSEAGIERPRYYFTNAVKHFKFEPRGKRRLHQRPNVGEIMRCRWWLDIERDLIKPKLIVAMGATAALAVTGNGDGVMKRRGSLEATGDGSTEVFVTIHPSAVLRAGDVLAQAEARKGFLDDLRTLARHLKEM